MSLKNVANKARTVLNVEFGYLRYAHAHQNFIPARNEIALRCWAVESHRSSGE